MSARERHSLMAAARHAGEIPRSIAWRAAYRQWPTTAVSEPSPGYTLLMPVPSDLPVFLRVTLANVAAQDDSDCAEILGIPDRPNAAIAAAFEACKAETSARNLRLVELPNTSRTLGRLSGAKPSTYHFLQIHAGVTEATTTHALLHDADLFLPTPTSSPVTTGVASSAAWPASAFHPRGTTGCESTGSDTPSRRGR